MTRKNQRRQKKLKNSKRNIFEQPSVDTLTATKSTIPYTSNLSVEPHSKAILNQPKNKEKKRKKERREGKIQRLVRTHRKLELKFTSISTLSSPLFLKSLLTKFTKLFSLFPCSRYLGSGFSTFLLLYQERRIYMGNLYPFSFSPPRLRTLAVPMTCSFLAVLCRVRTERKLECVGVCRPCGRQSCIRSD